MQIVLPDYPLHTRIAPTPSGFLHLGNGLSFVLSWLLARSSGGRIRLRIDDLDQGRVRAEYLEDIFVQLDFLGLDYDSGSSSIDQIYKSTQTRLLTDCQAIIDKLKKSDLLYACTRSRTGIDAPNPNNFNLRIVTKNQPEVRIYDLTTQKIMHENIDQIMPDFVVWTKESLPAYQLASLADDISANTNLIVRGQDLWPSSCAQAYLARCAGLKSFDQMLFWHHPLLLDANNQKKLSKSAGAYSIKEWVRQGGKASQIYASLANYLGFEPRSDYRLSDLVELLSANKNLVIKSEWRFL